MVLGSPNLFRDLCSAISRSITLDVTADQHSDMAPGGRCAVAYDSDILSNSSPSRLGGEVESFGNCALVNMGKFKTDNVLCGTCQDGAVMVSDGAGGDE